MLSRRLHVDPSAVVPAWAITSNKSMGGECKNVGVYVPPGIAQSFFDRSNLYVAFSRPIEYLGVVGRLCDIEALTMRDPRPVDTGLSRRLATADVTMPGEEPTTAWQWRDDVHDRSANGMLNPEIVGAFGNIYDQSPRMVYERPTALCAMSFKSYLASNDMFVDSAGSMAALKEFVRGVNERLYGHVQDHMPRVDAPWDAVAPPRPSQVMPLIPIGAPLTRKQPAIDSDDEEPAIEVIYHDLAVTRTLAEEIDNDDDAPLSDTGIVDDDDDDDAPLSDTGIADDDDGDENPGPAKRSKKDEESESL